MAESCGLTLHKDWYSILGACPTDDIQELKQKYQKLILKVGTQQIFPYISGSQTGKYLSILASCFYLFSLLTHFKITVL